MKKAEMEHHWREYHALMSSAHAARQTGSYTQLLDHARASWKHIDGMVQFERKYRGADTLAIEAIDLVLHYAPILFHFDCLNQLDALLREQRRIEKFTKDNLGAKLAAATSLMRDAHQIWNYIDERIAVAEEELLSASVCDRDRAQLVISAWIEMGILKRASDGGSHRLAWFTRMADVVPARCPNCGVAVKATKSKLVDSAACPKCRESVLFVLLSRQPASSH